MSMNGGGGDMKQNVKRQDAMLMNVNKSSLY